MATLKAERTQTEPPVRNKPGPKPKPFDYQKPKQAFRRPEDFTAWMAGYPDKSGVMAYFYRLTPRIDLSRIGIDTTAIHHTTKPEEMTADFCAGRFGRGKYMLKYTDANKKPEEMARTWFEIDDPDAAAPVYDVRTLLLNHPANGDEVARLLHSGILIRDSEFSSPRVRSEADRPVPVVAPAATPAAVPVAVSAAAVSPSVADSIVLKLLDRAMPSATPQTATEVLKQSFDIADRLRPQTVAGPSLEDIVERVVSRLNKPAASAPNELETWEKMNAFFERLGLNQKPAAVAEGSPAWVGVLTSLADRLLTPLVPVAVSFMMSKSRPPGPVAVPPRQVAGPPAVDSGMPPAPFPDSFPAFLPESAPIMSRIQQVVQFALEKQAAGVAGFRFASWLCAFYPGGSDIYRMMERAGGTGAALGMVAMVPELSGAMQDPMQAAALESWLDDFFTFNADIESDDEPDGDNPAGDIKAAA